MGRRGGEGRRGGKGRTGAPCGHKGARLVRRSSKSEGEASAERPEDLAYANSIGVERAAAFRRQPVRGPRHAAIERLRAPDVSGRLETTRVDAEVSVGG